MVNTNRTGGKSAWCIEGREFPWDAHLFGTDRRAEEKMDVCHSGDFRDEPCVFFPGNADCRHGHVDGCQFWVDLYL